MSDTQPHSPHSSRSSADGKSDHKGNAPRATLEDYCTCCTLSSGKSLHCEEKERCENGQDEKNKLKKVPVIILEQSNNHHEKRMQSLFSPCEEIILKSML